MTASTKLRIRVKASILCSLASLVLATSGLSAATKYDGPRPPKKDIPYLVHADNLVETEIGVAKQESRKNSQVATVPGATSPVKTPLSEPIFIIHTEKVDASKLAVYKLEVKKGNREVVVGQSKGRGASKPIFLLVDRLDDNLYKVEVDQPLENGEYVMSPDGSDDTFSFQIY
jgi:hypothetical protein